MIRGRGGQLGRKLTSCPMEEEDFITDDITTFNFIILHGHILRWSSRRLDDFLSEDFITVDLTPGWISFSRGGVYYPYVTMGMRLLRFSSLSSSGLHQRRLVEFNSTKMKGTVINFTLINSTPIPPRIVT